MTKANNKINSFNQIYKKNLLNYTFMHLNIRKQIQTNKRSTRPNLQFSLIFENSIIKSLHSNKYSHPKLYQDKGIIAKILEPKSKRPTFIILIIKTHNPFVQTNKKTNLPLLPQKFLSNHFSPEWRRRRNRSSPWNNNPLTLRQTGVPLPRFLWNIFKEEEKKIAAQKIRS